LRAISKTSGMKMVLMMYKKEELETLYDLFEKLEGLGMGIQEIREELNI